MILYHYTSAAGLYGIVASKSLWTSHYRFLNDTSEFRHGWDIVLAAIERGGAEIRQISSLAWEMIMLFREHSESVHAFVRSPATAIFCRNGAATIADRVFRSASTPTGCCRTRASPSERVLTRSRSIMQRWGEAREKASASIENAGPGA